MIVQFQLEGKAESIDMLEKLLPQESPLVAESDGTWWLCLEINEDLNIRTVESSFQSILDIVNGTIRLWTGFQDRIRIRCFKYQLSNGGREGGILMHAASIKLPFTPKKLEKKTKEGTFLGSAVIDLASRDNLAAQALSILATGATEWWQLYLLLEILKKAYESNGKSKSKGWPEIYQILSKKYHRKKSDIKHLKRTINFHRHASDSSVPDPWHKTEAVNFIHTAVRNWLEESI